jgi:cytochrome c
MRRWAIVIVLLGAMHLSARTQAGESAEGALLYQEQCSICHGMMASESSFRPGVPEPQELVRAGRALPSWAFGRAPDMQAARTAAATDGSERFLLPFTVGQGRLAVVPPYGPPLRGVIGRRAGSVAGFAYSRAFKTILHDVVWDRDTLDRWITDSQDWVPGSLMFYQQPDPEIRRQIIAYLEASH